MISIPFSGPDDLRRMQAMLSASWLARRPLVNTGVGDLEWWLVLGGPDAAWTDRIRLWPDRSGDGPPHALLGYAWLNPPAELDWHHRAGLDAGMRGVLVDEAIEWATGVVAGQAAAGGVAPPELLETWAMDADQELAGLLRDRGWTPAPEAAYTQWHLRLGRDPAAPAVPPGYLLRSVRMPGDLEARVEVHRSAFAPSRMTVERYASLLGMPHYAAERDVVVEAPDGSLAAFAIAWYDPVARVGELEPVGTHQDHRRLGLGLAVVQGAIRALRAAGAEDAVVLSATTNAASEALYATAGFTAVTRHRAWSRPIR